MAQDYERSKRDTENTLKEISDNYKDNFKKWKKGKEAAATRKENDLKRFQEIAKRNIKEKEAMIEEVEKSIKDLKEMSKETTKA